MAEQWYAVYETATGRLASIGSVLANPLPTGMTALPLAAEPTSADMWDEATRTFIPRPPKVMRDLVDTILADPDLPALNPVNRDRLRNVLVKHVVEGRFY